MTDWKNTTLAVRAIMGMETHSLAHPMWSEAVVLNGLAHITVWQDGIPAWSGIADTEEYRFTRLKNTFPACELSIAELEAGVHY